MKSRGTGTRPGCPPGGCSQPVFLGKVPKPLPQCPLQQSGVYAPPCLGPGPTPDPGGQRVQAPAAAKPWGSPVCQGLGCSCLAPSQGGALVWQLVGEGFSCWEKWTWTLTVGTGPPGHWRVYPAQRTILDREQKSSGQADHARKQPCPVCQCLSRHFPCWLSKGLHAAILCWTPRVMRPVLLRTAPHSTAR